MKPSSDTRKPYRGMARALVVALDVGTTFSGVSYAILEPGEVPKIHGVTRFPGQHVAGHIKIPSLLWYDKNGKMAAAGAEAEGVSVESRAEEEGWTKVELFKLRLRPRSMKMDMNGMRLGSLPRGKTSVEVFGDFLAYLFQCTRTFIEDTHANGAALWKTVKHDINFVLSHPNGWEGAQQTKMRRAAVHAHLVPDTDEGRARIRFVTEGEASLHSCVLNGLAAEVLSSPSAHGFTIADAGGGTLDISSYAIRNTGPLVIEEIAPPDCIFAGSVFVSRRARGFLQEKLKTSKYGSPDAIDHIVKRFDEVTKRLFRDKKDMQFIPFGSPLDKDLSVGIRGGQLKLTGEEVAKLFEPSIEAAIEAIRAQVQASNGLIKSVWLVGGFAASPWLFSQLQERLAHDHITVNRPDSQTSKAVADGGIGFYCDHHVSARMSKFIYGVEYLREFDPQDEEHVARQDRMCELPSGPKLLLDAFDCILARGIKVKESTVFSRKYCTELTNLSTLSVFEVEVFCYRGGDTIPKWILRDSEDFSTLCMVRADLSPLAGSAQPKEGRNGKTYWTIVFSIEIQFGLTEFKARIKWLDDGKVKYGPASIIYNESGHRAEDEADIPDEDDERTPSRAPSDAQRSPSSSPAIPRPPLPESVAASTAQTEVVTPNAAPVEANAPDSRSREITMAPGASEPSDTKSVAGSTGGHEGTDMSKDKGKQRATADTSRRSSRALSAVSVARSTSSTLATALTSVWGAVDASLASEASLPSSQVHGQAAEQPAAVASSKTPTQLPSEHPSKAPSQGPTKPSSTTISNAPSKRASKIASEIPSKALSRAPSKMATRAASQAASPKTGQASVIDVETSQQSKADALEELATAPPADTPKGTAPQESDEVAASSTAGASPSTVSNTPEASVHQNALDAAEQPTTSTESAPDKPIQDAVQTSVDPTTRIDAPSDETKPNEGFSETKFKGPNTPSNVDQKSQVAEPFAESGISTSDLLSDILNVGSVVADHDPSNASSLLGALSNLLSPKGSSSSLPSSASPKPDGRPASNPPVESPAGAEDKSHDPEKTGETNPEQAKTEGKQVPAGPATVSVSGPIQDVETPLDGVDKQNGETEDMTASGVGKRSTDRGKRGKGKNGEELDDQGRDIANPDAINKASEWGAELEDWKELLAHDGEAADHDIDEDVFADFLDGKQGAEDTANDTDMSSGWGGLISGASKAGDKAGAGMSGSSEPVLGVDGGSLNLTNIDAIRGTNDRGALWGNWATSRKSRDRRL